MIRVVEEAWSSDVDAHLQEAGWHPDRRVDVQAWVDELSAEGFEPHAAATEFLAEFGGLHIPRRGRSGVDVAPAEVEFDPTLCAGQREWFDEFRESVTGRLYPVGEAGGGHASLAIDESGAVYLLFGKECRRVGVGSRAVANMVEGRRESEPPRAS